VIWLLVNLTLLLPLGIWLADKVGKGEQNRARLRDDILALLTERMEPTEAAEIWSILENRDKKTSLGAVYILLDQMAKDGRVTYVERLKRYEANRHRAEPVTRMVRVYTVVK
jgi:Fe2+ or Zn2+ uptake regulation protein